MLKFVRLFVAVMLGFSIWTLISWGLGRLLIVQGGLEQADVILVLSGSAEFNERCETGARLFRRRVAGKIILTDDGERSGWDAAAETNPLFVERAFRRLTELGVNPGSIEILPGKVNSTADEAQLFARYAIEQRITSAMLVTSSYHTRRAKRTFDRAADGIVKFGIASSRASGSANVVFSYPRKLQTVGTEYVKTAYYWWKY